MEELSRNDLFKKYIQYFRLSKKMHECIKNPIEDLKKKEVLDFVENVKSRDYENITFDTLIFYAGCVEVARQIYYRTYDSSVFKTINEIYKMNFNFEEETQRRSWIGLVSNVYGLKDYWISIVDFMSNQNIWFPDDYKINIFLSKNRNNNCISELWKIPEILELVDSEEDPVQWLKERDIEYKKFQIEQDFK
jgi:hypothetical protein